MSRIVVATLLAVCAYAPQTVAAQTLPANTSIRSGTWSANSAPEQRVYERNSHLVPNTKLRGEVYNGTALVAPSVEQQIKSMNALGTIR